MSESKNPYRKGSHYHALFATLVKKQAATRPFLVEEAKKLGLGEDAAQGTITVLLSPRNESKRGDCRGNVSSQGHVYYIEKIKGKPGEEAKYRPHYRPTPLEPRKRVATPKVEQNKESTKVHVTNTKPVKTEV